MKILMFNETAAPCGGEMNYYVFDIAERLRASGDSVALVHGRQQKSQFKGVGYIFDHLRTMNAPIEDVRLRLEAIVEDFKPDVIQLHGVPNLGLDPWLAERAPTARWIHNHLLYCSGQTMTLGWPRQPCMRSHGPWCLGAHVLHGCGSLNPLRNLLQFGHVSASLAALRQATGLQVASRMLADNLVRNGIAANRVEHLPLYAAPSAEARKTISKPTPLQPAQRRFILHPGGLVRHKGAWLLVHNIDQLPDDVDIVFAGGGGELQPALEKYVAEHRVSDRVRIMGVVSPVQWSSLFYQASIVVLPSFWNEPLGLAGIYAMAHSKPVVAFRSGGIDEWLEHGRTGIAVPFGARDAFIEAVVRLLNDGNLQQCLATQAHDAWDARFRPEHHLANLRNYYARLAKG